ncbi:hypothetical protein ACFWY9_04560 [Amycolatopsis sp. NPDC059027]|uniref:hypothetical protein n=1 Tax=unclassified Amycolatopsis TaxID=2618356 RepID=UPI003672F4D3
MTSANADEWALVRDHLHDLVQGGLAPLPGGRLLRVSSERLGDPAALRELVRWAAMLETWIPTDVTPTSFCEDQLLQQARSLLAGTWPPRGA